MRRRIFLIAGIILFILATLFLVNMFRRPKMISSGGVFGNKKSGALFPVSSASALYKEAREMEAKEEFYEAKTLYQRLVSEYPNSSDITKWQSKLEELNIKLLFSPVQTSKSTIYEVKSGDNLTKIAKQFKTTVELIQKANGLTDSKIMPGQKLKVWTSNFSIFVDKSQNVLVLKSNDEIIKTYTVATGTDNSTPVGKFKIVNKLLNPTWFKAGAVVAPDSPENILGSRWMGINVVGYGIHGTTDPKSVGKQVTQGCVRMVNSDAEELYAIIPVGTEVTIAD